MSKWRLNTVVAAIVLFNLGSTQLVCGQQQVLFQGPSISGEASLSKLTKGLPIGEQQNKNRLLVKNGKPADQQQQQQQQQQQSINLVEADENGLYLVGLFDIHHSNPRAPLKCGPIDIDAGEWQSRRPMQNLEAFLWAIEQVNADRQLLPGVKLGSLVLDTCSSFLRTNQQLANLLHPHPQQSNKLPNVRQLVGIVADNQDWPTVEAVASMSSAVGLTTFVTQSRSTKLAELARKYSSSDPLPFSPAGIILETPGPNQPGGSGAASTASSHAGEVQFEGLLGELVGIGKMLPQLNFNSSEPTAPASQQHQHQHQQQETTGSSQQLYMVRMLLGNEFLADSLASLCQQMGWDLVSLIYDDELDMVDLHDELTRQLFARNIQLALDEQIPISSPAESYSKLLQRLASKTQIGSRVVLTLLGTGSARLLLESFVNLRNQAKSAPSLDPKLAKQANSLLWVTLSDREPYYSMATNALGTISISNSVSLIPEFKSHFDNLTGDQKHLAQNRWWPEYMRSILLRHQKDIELISNECAKWQEPRTSLLPEKCRSLSLSDLVKLDQLNNPTGKVATSGGEQKNKSRQPRLSKYLAGGWEHNGLDVINSVLSIANGLESIRQTLCPGKLEGVCDEMRRFINGSDDQQPPVPTMSELIYNELLRSTFQLADGRLFNLIDESESRLGTASGNSHQLEGKLKLFNLRHLQPNSIGFVKFGTFDRQDGLIINSSKALHYSPDAGLNPKKSSVQKGTSVPLDQIKSTCEDSTKCLVLSQFLAAGVDFSSAAEAAAAVAAVTTENSTTGGMKGAISDEEELASRLNSLFKLDHPAIVSGQQQQPDKQQMTAGGSGQSKQQAADKPQQQQQQQQQFVAAKEVEGEREMRWQPPISDHFNWPDAQQNAASVAANGGSNRTSRFEVVVLLPLHKRLAAHEVGQSNRSCSRQLNLDSSFQHLAALGFASQSLSSSLTSAATTMMSGQQDDSKQIMELTTTVIDYCEQLELAEQKLSARLARSPAKSSIVAVVDFDESVSRQVENVLASANLLHLTIGSSTVPASDNRLSSKSIDKQQQHLHLSLMPSKTSEIDALLGMISAMPRWKLVHLIYTDHHHYRDEFVRRANEANICVSKLIWIPHVSSSELPSSVTTFNAENEYGRQLEKTRKLFTRELHDYRSMASNGAKLQQQQDLEGLNSTRVLVVLASGNRQTNKLILEAASESMLEDYVWLTSHEWLSAESSRHGSDDESVPIAKRQKPNYFVSTKFETSHESHEFADYFNQLTPALHRPLPTDWFDEFWQQTFTCRLPLASKSTPTAAGQQVCAPNNRLRLVSSKLDDRVHFVIRTIAALYSTLQQQQQQQLGVESKEPDLMDNKQKLMNNFREKFESIDKHDSQPYGFQIVHQLLPDLQDSNTTTTTSRRQNSRQLENEDEQLVRVGIWRNGELILASRLASASKFDSGQDLPAWLASESDSEGSRMQKSLQKLESIESRCLQEKTCRLCEQQIEQTNKLIQQEEARLLQSQSVAEPKAISSIDSALKPTGGKSRKKSSIIDSSPGSPFDSTDEDQPEQQQQQQDDIQAAASSLFDKSVKQQVQLEQQNDLRRHYAEQQQQQQARPGQPRQVVIQSRHPALFGILLSLAGIICMLFTMIRLHPRSANCAQRRTKGACKLDGSGGGSLYGSEMTLYDATSSSSLQTWMQPALVVGNKEAHLINYFLLTGLLMLYSINVAFVLPATMSVCWFRRIGLAASYSLILSSILAQVLSQATLRESRRRNVLKQQQRPVYLEEDPAGGGGDESEVEVTFESLPPIQETVPNEPLPAAIGQQHDTSLPGANRGYQANELPRRAGAGAGARGSGSGSGQEQEGSGMPLTISLGLILIQIVVSFVWLIEQPPEPTLYLSCWYCSSPSRSQTLFLLEPLLSLLYPAFILLLAWSSSLVYYHVANKKATQRRRLLASGTTRIAQQNDCCEIDYCKVRDSKSSVIATTLLIFTWSIVTLKMISSSDAKFQPAAANNLESKFDCNTTILVYANIISGAIVFASLFLYRLKLVQCNPLRWKLTGSRGSNGKSMLPKKNGAQNLSPSSSFRSILSDQTGGASHWMDTNSSSGHLFYTRTISEFTPRTDLPVAAAINQHERLGLRQFNSYGTYNQSDGEQYSLQQHAECDTNNRSDASGGTKSKQKKSRRKLFGGSASKQTGETESQQDKSKLQRRLSSGSAASSTTKLVDQHEASVNHYESDDDDDAISCASSVASSSTSQLHGNDLYPIDCSLQLDSQLPEAAQLGRLTRSSSFKRQSLRRSVNKLSSVSEERDQ